MERQPANSTGDTTNFMEQTNSPGDTPKRVYIVSYPRSGNTWTRVLLEHSLDLVTRSIYEEASLSRVVGSRHRTEATDLNDRMDAPVDLIKSHEKKIEGRDPVIYVLRDGRDATISYWHYLQEFESRKLGSFSEFMRNLQAGGNWWPDHVRDWLIIDREHPKLIVRYEDLLQDQGKELSRILSFLGLAPVRKFEEFRDNIAFSSLKEQLPTFFRSGRAGGWETAFSEDDKQFFLENDYGLLTEFGYLEGQGRNGGRKLRRTAHMGAVDFSLSTSLLDLLQSVLPLKTFVETGSFEGDTIQRVCGRFNAVHSIELSEEYHSRVVERFRSHPEIHLHLGHSPEILRTIKPEIGETPALYWLDAHWCVADGAAGGTSQCPVLDELEAIGQLDSESVILIDDARMFLCPPLYPHAIEHWPTLEEIEEKLRASSSVHEIMILNDVIMFYPKAIRFRIREYAHHNSIDWLEAVQKARSFEDLRKEIRGMNRRLIENETEIAQLRQHVANLENREKELTDQRNVREKELIDQRDVREKELIAKEEVIQSLITYRRFSIKYLLEKSCLSLKKMCSPHLLRFAKAVRNGLTPSLVKLHQYDPKPLQLVYRKTPSINGNPLPRISMVTPSFNQGRFIQETIESIVQQHYPNLEFFIQDGGSNDGTQEILAQYSSKVTGFESAPDGGQANAINVAFKRTSGEIMAWLNADDVLLPGTLEYVAEYFGKHPKTDVVYGDRIIIDENSREIGRWLLPSHDDEVVTWVDFVPQETLFWRRRIWEKVGGSLDESFHFALDWDLILRFREAGANFVHLPRYMAAFRVHSEQKTTREITSRGFEEMYRLRARCHGRHVTHAEAVRHTYGYLVKHIISRWTRHFRLIGGQ